MNLHITKEGEEIAMLRAELAHAQAERGAANEQFDAAHAAYSDLKSRFDALVKERAELLEQKPVAWGDVAVESGYMTTNKQLAERYSAQCYTLTALFVRPIPPAIPEE